MKFFQNDNNVLQHLSLVLQQTNNSIAADKPICIKDQHPRLIEK
jgi:hypothetical protein